jgi:hypothetical protein
LKTFPLFLHRYRGWQCESTARMASHTSDTRDISALFALSSALEGVVALPVAVIAVIVTVEEDLLLWWCRFSGGATTSFSRPLSLVRTSLCLSLCPYLRLLGGRRPTSPFLGSWCW